ncbi:alginate lyase family protein [Telluribacter sp. SYSU D00476]|uniref:alginate lyase family protein n=1 Tax=Telluribacter sp. SYSU D00476 TaxID=2811430 RepID=UPI001FF34266|nr:alginate lyase family protein [Telluribacter sp. SYSU D00476]
MEKGLLLLLNHFSLTGYTRYVLLLLLLLPAKGSALGESYQERVEQTIEIKKLLSRLNLDAPGLARVKAAAPTPELAAIELLTYYRTRTSVKHPVERQVKAAMRGSSASEKDIQVANDALKHVFVGQPAYPSHFCGDDINWATNPYPDKEWVWQLNRMSFWDAMARAYWHTGDEKYAREWCAQLVDWTRKNPRDDQHQYAWRSIEAGIRGYRWTGLFEYFIDSPHFTPDVLVAFLNSCYDHSSYLMTRYTKGSNWGLMEAEGMAFIAMTFPEFQESKQWKEEAIRRLNQEITSQVYPDGHQRELAFGYHMGCIGWFMRTYELAQLNGQADAFSDSYTKIIEKMCEVPMKLSFPDGTTPQFGDAWSGTPGQYYRQLREWAKLFNRPDFLYVATEGNEGTRPEATAFAYDKSGLYSMRSSWDKDAITLVLKCGPDGGGHSQPDNGTFELYAGGRHLMPDAGSYIYSGDPEGRRWFRQTKVHQTLTLNEANSAYAPSLRLWKPGPDMDVLVVENKSYPDLTHRRAVLFVDRKYFVLVDEAIGEGTGDVDLHFQLAPGEAVFDQNNHSVHSDFKEGWNVLVQAVEQPGIKLEAEEGQVSFVYTKKEPRPAFRYRLPKTTTENGLRFVTLVVPYTGSRPSVSARVVGQPPVGASQIELEVVVDGVKKHLTYQL